MAAMDRLILLDADTVIVDDVCAAHEVFYELAPGIFRRSQGDQDVFNLISNQKPGWFDILSWEWNLQLAVCQHYPHDEALNVLLPQAKIVHGSDGHFNKHAGSLIEHVYEAFAVDSRSVARMASIKTMVVMVIWSFAGVAFD
ncbi:hypothetical protein WJX77_003932 [Trebouxia sp. C0004]